MALKMPIKLTERKALEICRELWVWMKSDPDNLYSEKKKEWPGWSKYGYMLYGCPCCEYIIKNDGYKDGHCVERCPLRELWKKTDCDDEEYVHCDNGDYVHCTHPKSAYERAISNHSSDSCKIEAAQEIIDGCDEALRKLDEKEQQHDGA